MKPYTLTIRFRETDEYEAEVGAIDLIAEYMKRSEQERRENNFIERLRKMIREELETSAINIPDSVQQAEITSFISEMTEDEEAANAASVLDDLELFC